MIQHHYLQQYCRVFIPKSQLYHRRCIVWTKTLSSNFRSLSLSPLYVSAVLNEYRDGRLCCKNTIMWHGRGSNRILPWWHHQMEPISALLPLCVENSQVTSEFVSQRPVTCSLNVFCDLRLKKCLGKQPRRWWFETPSCSLWYHCNATNIPRYSRYSKSCFARNIYGAIVHGFRWYT